MIRNCFFLMFTYEHHEVLDIFIITKKRWRNSVECHLSLLGSLTNHRSTSAIKTMYCPIINWHNYYNKKRVTEVTQKQEMITSRRRTCDHSKIKSRCYSAYWQKKNAHSPFTTIIHYLSINHIGGSTLLSLSHFLNNEE